MENLICRYPFAPKIFKYTPLLELWGFLYFGIWEVGSEKKAYDWAGSYICNNVGDVASQKEIGSL